MFGMHIGRLGGQGRVIFSPKRLFGAIGQGAWYEPSLTNGASYQDGFGTLPVTGAGQMNGLILDKRLGLVRGVELWDDANAGSNGESSKVSAGVYRVYSSAGAGSNISLVTPFLVLGKTYEVAYTIDSIALAGGGVRTCDTGVVRTALGRVSEKFLATNNLCFIKRVAGATDIQISNVSVKLLEGNHARQATASARPLYQSGPDRLVFDGGDDAHVTAFAAALGSTCTVVRSVPGVGTIILTGQTIGTTYTNTVTHSGLIVIDRPLTASETLAVTRWGNQRAGV